MKFRKRRSPLPWLVDKNQQYSQLKRSIFINQFVYITFQHQINLMFRVTGLNISNLIHAYVKEGELPHYNTMSFYT